MKKKLVVLGVVALMLAFVAGAVAMENPFGEPQWSGWTSVTGSDLLEYRWGVLSSSTQVQFRNLSEDSLRFNYAVWMVGQDRPATGSLSIPGNGKTVAEIYRGIGEKPQVDRVVVSAVTKK